jgi:hypothetical protein
MKKITEKLQIINYETGDEIQKKNVTDLDVVVEDYVNQLQEWADDPDNRFSQEGVEGWKRKPVIYVTFDHMQGYQAVDPSGAEIRGFYIRPRTIKASYDCELYHTEKPNGEKITAVSQNSRFLGNLPGHREDIEGDELLQLHGMRPRAYKPLKSDRLYIRISPEEKRHLELIAKEEMRSMSNVARLAIQEFIQSHQRAFSKGDYEDRK